MKKVIEIYTCDCCGEQIKTPVYTVGQMEAVLDEYTFLPVEDRVYPDFCEECAHHFHDLLWKALAKVREDEDSAESADQPEESTVSTEESTEESKDESTVSTEESTEESKDESTVSTEESKDESTESPSESEVPDPDPEETTPDTDPAPADPQPESAAADVLQPATDSVAPADEALPDADTPKKTGRRKREVKEGLTPAQIKDPNIGVDTKIIALTKAGWTQADIAKALHVGTAKVKAVRDRYNLFHAAAYGA